MSKLENTAALESQIKTTADPSTHHPRTEENVRGSVRSG
jgi:hypothetical protein